MKQSILILVLMAAPVLGAGTAVTQAQVQQAQKGAQDLLTAIQPLLRYCNSVSDLFATNFTFTVPGSTLTITADPATQNQLIDVAQYQKLKADVVAAFNELP